MKERFDNLYSKHQKTGNRRSKSSFALEKLHHSINQKILSPDWNLARTLRKTGLNANFEHKDKSIISLIDKAVYRQFGLL